jgi:D-alanyl-D-alanine carboxypeptidase
VILRWRLLATSLGLALLTLNSSRAQQTLSPAQLVERTRIHLAALAKHDEFSGIVLIAKENQQLFLQAYGYANLADHIPNHAYTKFNMASMGKMITAVATMQLVEAGNISLSEKVGKYLPDLPNVAVRDGVTVEELLTHTSGMGNFWAQLDNKAKEKYVAVSDYVPLFADERLAFEPGKGFLYSNNGYTVLGLIIEKVSGQTYFDYVRKHVYQPSGMLDTDAYELNEPIPNMATGYSRDLARPGQIVSNFYVNTFKGGPAGGSYTTAADLLRFTRALMQHKLLNAADTDLLIRGKVDYGTRRYGYGFTEETIGGHRLVGHGGGANGISNELQIYVDLGYTVVILTNGDVENFWDVQNFFKRELLGASPQSRSYDFTKRMIDVADTKGYETAQRLLQSETSSPGLRAGVLEQVGYKFLWQGKVASATAVFKLYALNSPQDEYAWLGLGKAEEQAGDRANALIAYRRYLALEPGNEEINSRVSALTTSP